MKTRTHARLIFLFCAFVILGQPAGAPAQPESRAAAGWHQHDFDFEFGRWNVQIRRLLHPLAHSNVWVHYHGLSSVRKVWAGRANLGELEVDGPNSHLEGLSLRLYDPRSRQWSIFWANSKDGDLGKPMVGNFKAGRGEFHDQETFGGAPIGVRFFFSGVSTTAFRLVQSFSADGGKTWEPNWVATFTRIGT